MDGFPVSFPDEQPVAPAGTVDVTGFSGSGGEDALFDTLGVDGFSVTVAFSEGAVWLTASAVRHIVAAASRKRSRVIRLTGG